MVKLTKTFALKSLQLLKGSETKDEDLSFACGILGTNKAGKDRYVFIVSKKSPSAVLATAKGAEWGAVKGQKSDDDYEAISHGLARIEGGKLSLRYVKKASKERVQRAAKGYFKTEWKLNTFWIGVEESDEDLDAESIEKTFVAGDDDDLTDLPTAEEIEALSSSIEGEEGEGAVDPNFDRASETVTDASAAQTPDISLPPDIDTLIQADLKKQVDLLFAVAPGIGMTLKGTADDVLNNLYAILKSILLANPPPTLEKAANWLARFQLAMNSNTESMRAAGRPGKNQRASAAGNQAAAANAAADGTDIIPGVDPSKLSTDPLSQQEVIDALKEYVLSQIEGANQRREEAKEPLLDAGSADMAKIQTLVEKNWAGEGLKQLETVNRYLGLFNKVCSDEKSLINFLSIKLEAVTDETATKFDATAPDASMSAQLDELVIQPLMESLTYAHASVSGAVKSLIDEAEQALFQAMGKTVADLGGSWNDVMDFLGALNVDTARGALQKILNATGQGRVDAIANARSVAAQLKTVLESNRLATLLDESPFATKPEIKALLIGSLNEIEGELDKLSKQQQKAA